MSAVEHESDAVVRRRRRRILALFVALTAAALALSLGKAELDRYAAEDPSFCQTCHAVRPGFTLWASDAHARLACQACHALDQDQLRAMLVAAVVGAPEAGHPKLDPAHIRCEACHLAPERQQEPVMASPGHLQHTRSVKVSCLQCHGSRVHGLVRPDTVCKRCHAELVRRADRMNEVHCQTCHNFLDPRTTILPSRADCQGCHDRQRVREPESPPDGHMVKLPCFACHAPHVAADPGDACAACHVRADASAEHRRHAQYRCQRCHAPHGFGEPAGLCASHHHPEARAPALERTRWRFEGSQTPRAYDALLPARTSSAARQPGPGRRPETREDRP